MRGPGSYDTPHVLVTTKAEINDVIRRAKAAPTYGHRWLAYLAEWPGVLQITERQVRQSMVARWRVSIQGPQVIVRFDHAQEPTGGVTPSPAPQRDEFRAMAAELSHLQVNELPHIRSQRDVALAALRDMERWLANTNKDADHPWRVSLRAAIAKAEGRQS